MRNAEREKRLIEEWQSGSNTEESFKLLFERYSPPVSHFFKKHGFPDEDCLDLTQETFIKVHQGLSNFQFESTFETWLFQIVRNIRKNALRHKHARKREGEDVSLVAEGGDDVLSSLEIHTDTGKPEPGPLANTLVKEELRSLRDALLRLPAIDQRCLLLCVKGLKYQEIADVLGIPLGSVKSRISKTRDLLKAAQSEPRRKAG